jgi:hypothetical protein
LEDLQQSDDERKASFIFIGIGDATQKAFRLFFKTASSLLFQIGTGVPGFRNWKNVSSEFLDMLEKDAHVAMAWILEIVGVNCDGIPELEGLLDRLPEEVPLPTVPTVPKALQKPPRVSLKRPSLKDNLSEKSDAELLEMAALAEFNAASSIKRLKLRCA